MNNLPKGIATIAKTVPGQYALLLFLDGSLRRVHGPQVGGLPDRPQRLEAQEPAHLRPLRRALLYACSERRDKGTYLHPMTNRDNIQRLVEHITGDLASVKALTSRVEMHVEDLSALNELTGSALGELSVFTDSVHTADESAAVKPLHDRVHVVVVQLRVLRNTLEQMENAAESALDNVRRISAGLEEAAPEDDSL